MGIELGFLSIDFSPLLEAASRSPLHAFWYFFTHGGWAVILITLFYGGRAYWLFWRQNLHAVTWKWVLLSVNVPKDNAQSPKAVENIFSHLAGAHASQNLIDKWWLGKFQESFSLEIASTGGYVQFYIRTTEKFRDLAEAAIYAQYPAAEIAEVEDYTAFAPAHFPDPEYKLWGTEMTLINKQHFPIRSYVEFEHQLSQEFKDPMAALLESMSKLGPGEHLWIQVIVAPTNDAWKEEGIKLAKKLVGAKVESKPTLFEKALGVPADMITGIVSEALGSPMEESASKKDGPASIMQFLSPGERRVLEALQFKLSKIGFYSKVRFIYLGKREVYSKARGAMPIIGALKQFTSLDLNGFKPYKPSATMANYFMVDKRVAEKQTRIMKAYRGRSLWTGGNPYILNLEELASIFHFPVAEVKTPLVQKAESKRMEPPIGLPMHGALSSRRSSAAKAPAPEELPFEESEDISDEEAGGPPANLPVG